jgi:hypothetical protein
MFRGNSMHHVLVYVFSKFRIAYASDSWRPRSLISLGSSLDLVGSPAFQRLVWVFLNVQPRDDDFRCYSTQLPFSLAYSGQTTRQVNMQTSGPRGRQHISALNVGRASLPVFGQCRSGHAPLRSSSHLLDRSIHTSDIPRCFSLISSWRSNTVALRS